MNDKKALRSLSTASMESEVSRRRWDEVDKKWLKLNESLRRIERISKDTRHTQLAHANRPMPYGRVVVVVAAAAAFLLGARTAYVCWMLFVR